MDDTVYRQDQWEVFGCLVAGLVGSLSATLCRTIGPDNPAAQTVSAVALLAASMSLVWASAANSKAAGKPKSRRAMVCCMVLAMLASCSMFIVNQYDQPGGFFGISALVCMDLVDIILIPVLNDWIRYLISYRAPWREIRYYVRFR